MTPLTMPPHRTIRQAVALVASVLTEAGIDEARLEADLLVAHALGTSRTGLYARLGETLAPSALLTLSQTVDRRLLRMPLAYILGWREFYGLRFAVRPGVLVPRPETETLVEETLAFVRGRCGPHGEGVTIADVGCGSGAVAVTLAVHLRAAALLATDTSDTALAVTRENAAQHEVLERITLLQGDLLAPLPAPVDVVVANLPYVPTEDLARAQPELAHEPAEALDGGPDGLSVIRRLLEQVPDAVNPGGAVLMECDARHAHRLAAHCRDAFPGATVQVVRDMGGRDRVVRVVLA